MTTGKQRTIGVSAHLTKPVRRNELRFAIAHATHENPGCVAPSALEARPVAKRDRRITALPQKILLVEDVPVNQMLAVRILEKAGHQVAVVDNRRDALETLGRRSFDLVLMDVQMPEMDGFEAALEVRKRGSRVPIVAMTAYAMTGDRERCLAAGMDGYISKPIHSRELLDAVDRYGIGIVEATAPGGGP